MPIEEVEDIYGNIIPAEVTEHVVRKATAYADTTHEAKLEEGKFLPSPTEWSDWEEPSMKRYTCTVEQDVFATSPTAAALVLEEYFGLTGLDVQVNPLNLQDEGLPVVNRPLSSERRRNNDSTDSK